VPVGFGRDFGGANAARRTFEDGDRDGLVARRRERSGTDPDRRGPDANGGRTAACRRSARDDEDERRDLRWK
jgi:hypothetical protein